MPSDAKCAVCEGIGNFELSGGLRQDCVACDGTGSAAKAKLNGYCPHGEFSVYYCQQCDEDAHGKKDAEIARLRAALGWYESTLCSAADGHDDEAAEAHADLIGDAGARARRALDGKEADGAR